jgi:ABC-type hemin transport system substrate-binding protein
MQDLEERVRDLEKDSKSVATQLAENNLKIVHLSEKVTDMTEQLGQRLDRIGKHFESQNEKSEKLADEVQHLKKVEQNRARSKATLKKVIMAAVLAAAGVLGTKAAERYLVSSAVAAPPAVRTIDGGR